jgi:tripartite-type tricarboxylate transporter receptor subunit TctC
MHVIKSGGAGKASRYHRFTCGFACSVDAACPGTSPRQFESIEKTMLIIHRLAVAVSFALSAAVPAAAADYPDHPVRIITPFGVGGPADVYSRQIALFLSARLRQAFLVENRTGGAAVIGTDAAAKSAADGYTLLTISNALTANETLIPNKPYALMRDFVPVAGLNYSGLVMVVHPSVPANNLQEFVALAQAKPGQLHYASAGTGTPYHMAAELFKKMTGADIVHVPYQASADQRKAVLERRVDMTFDAITTMAAKVKGGSVHALGTSEAMRSRVLPDVPTISEAGVPGFEAVVWLGLVAPAGTPKPVVDKLNAAVNQTLALPEIAAAWERQGAKPMTMTPAEFDAFVRKDIEKWAQVAKFAGTVEK